MKPSRTEYVHDHVFSAHISVIYKYYVLSLVLFLLMTLPRRRKPQIVDILTCNTTSVSLTHDTLCSCNMDCVPWALRPL